MNTHSDIVLFDSYFCHFADFVPTLFESDSCFLRTTGLPSAEDVEERGFCFKFIFLQQQFILVEPWVGQLGPPGKMLEIRRQEMVISHSMDSMV